MAGKNIKGITVEINGETGPLQNALKDVNKTSYDLKNELKQVDKALKLDPTNVDLLRQKQELLAQSVTNTSEKLETLKAAEVQAQAAFANGEISAEQYRALQREVVLTQGTLDDLEESASTSNVTFSKVSESAAKMGDKVIVAGVAAVGAGLVATAVAGVTMGDDLTKALNGIEAATGYSKEAMSGMKDTMLSIYNNNFGEDFADIGASLQEVGKQTGLTGKDLETMTTNALLLRDTFEYEVADSTKAATMMMNQFGSSGEDAFNLIAQGAQWGLDKNGDLLDSINEYSTNFAMAGLSSTDMFNMFENGASAGVISTDKIGDAIKEFGIRSKDLSTGSTDAFKSLGLNADTTFASFAKGGDSAKKAFVDVNKKLFEMKDPLAQNTTGTALYGSMWEDVGMKGIRALTSMNGEISTTTDALKGINDVKYNTFGEGIEGIKRQLVTGLVIPIGEDLLPKLNEFGSELKEKLPSIIATLKPIMQSLIDKIVFLANNLNIILPIIATVLATLIGFSIAAKVATLIGTISGVIAVLTTGAAAATPVIGGLAATFTFITGPVGIVIAIIAALVIGFTLLWKHCEGFRTFWINLWEGIKTTTKVVVDALVNFFTVTIPGAWNGLVSFFTGIPAWFSNLWNGVKTTTTIVWTSIGTFFTTLWTGIKTFFVTIWNLIVSGVMAILNPFIQGVINIFNSMKDGFTTIFEGIKMYFTGVWMAIKLIFLGPILLILDLCTGNFGKLKTDTIALFNGLKDAFKLIWDGIKLIFTGVVTAISSFLKLEWNGIVNIAKTIWNGLKDFMKGLWDGIKDTAKSAWDGLKTTVTNICKSIVSGAKDVWDGLLTWFKELPGKLKTIGSSMFTSMKDGVTNTIGNVSSAIKTGLNDAIKFITGLPGEAVGWGKDMIDGIVRGIKNAAGAVGDAIKGVAQDIRSFLHFSVPDQGPLVDYESWMPDFMGGLANGIRNSKSLVTNAIKGLSTDMSIGMSLSPSMLGVGSSVGQFSNQGNTTTNTYGSVLHTDNINIGNGMDIESLATELAFYVKQKQLGGSK